MGHDYETKRSSMGYNLQPDNFCGFLILPVLKLSTGTISFLLFSYTQVRDWDLCQQYSTLSKMH